MKKILSNAERYLPFLREKDETGLSVSEKIMKLFSFQIPYYVGPLAKNDNSRFAWIVRKSDDAIRPWNFEECVDVDATAEMFIRRINVHIY